MSALPLHDELQRLSEAILRIERQIDALMKTRDTALQAKRAEQLQELQAIDAAYQPEFTRLIDLYTDAKRKRAWHEARQSRYRRWHS